MSLFSPFVAPAKPEKFKFKYLTHLADVKPTASKKKAVAKKVKVKPKAKPKAKKVKR